jgi:hypothetical protein
VPENSTPVDVDALRQQIAEIKSEERLLSIAAVAEVCAAAGLTFEPAALPGLFASLRSENEDLQEMLMAERAAASDHEWRAADAIERSRAALALAGEALLPFVLCWEEGVPPEPERRAMYYKARDAISSPSMERAIEIGRARRDFIDRWRNSDPTGDDKLFAAAAHLRDLEERQ